MKIFLLTGLVLTMSLGAGCAARYPVIVPGENAEKTRAGILERVPVGTPVERAADIMRANGFTCESMRNAAFLDRERIDFLYCDRERAVGLMVGRRWQVALVEEEGRVMDVLVGTGLIGP
jgi:hypothetical protein